MPQIRTHVLRIRHRSLWVRIHGMMHTLWDILCGYSNVCLMMKMSCHAGQDEDQHQHQHSSMSASRPVISAAARACGFLVPAARTPAHRTVTSSGTVHLGGVVVWINEPVPGSCPLCEAPCVPDSTVLGGILVLLVYVYRERFLLLVCSCWSCHRTV